MLRRSLKQRIARFCVRPDRSKMGLEKKLNFFLPGGCIGNLGTKKPPPVCGEGFGGAGVLIRVFGRLIERLRLTRWLQARLSSA
jgi:hypothetical protein